MPETHRNEFTHGSKSANRECESMLAAARGHANRVCWACIQRLITRFISSIYTPQTIRYIFTLSFIYTICLQYECVEVTAVATSNEHRCVNSHSVCYLILYHFGRIRKKIGRRQTNVSKGDAEGERERKKISTKHTNQLSASYRIVIDAISLIWWHDTPHICNILFLILRTHIFHDDVETGVDSNVRRLHCFWALNHEPVMRRQPTTKTAIITI